MNYEDFIYKMGSLFSMLSQWQEDGEFQGEHTLSFTGSNGTKKTVHIYGDGYDFQISGDDESSGLNLNIDVLSDTSD